MRVSKDGPLAPACAIHPSRQAFGPPQDEGEVGARVGAESGSTAAAGVGTTARSEAGVWIGNGSCLASLDERPVRAPEHIGLNPPPIPPWSNRPFRGKQPVLILKEHSVAWSPQQDEALKEAAAWLKRGDRQVFRLFGFAGTGKTTLARHLAEGIDGDVCFGAFTGKAAHVLRQKGCEDAGTIHSLIYRPRSAKEEDDLDDDDDDSGPQFAIKRDSQASTASLIVIDECSMVDEDLGKDLLSFGTPVLVLGDPAQLPPVKGGGFFTEAEPT